MIEFIKFFFELFLFIGPLIRDGLEFLLESHFCTFLLINVVKLCPLCLFLLLLLLLLFRMVFEHNLVHDIILVLLLYL